MLLAVAKEYLERFSLLPIFIDENLVPLHQWRKYLNPEKYSEYKHVLGDIYRHAKSKAKKQNSKMGIALATGPYQEMLDNPSAVVDIDKFPADLDRRKVAVELVKRGYAVVFTRRGLHIHFKLRDEKPYMIIPKIEKIDEEKKYLPIGEGGVLFPHPWTSPPTSRYINGHYYHYGFVKPDGKITTSIEYLRKIELPTVSLQEASADLYDVARIILVGTSRSPNESQVRLAFRQGDIEVGDRKYHLYETLEELLIDISSKPIVLPLCIALVLYAYFEAIGDINGSTNILYTYQDAIESLRAEGILTDDYKIAEGYRFLLGSAFVLFTTSLVDIVKWEEIDEILEKALENYPNDTGVSLPTKLSYLVITDGETLYPRYTRLGTIGEQLKPIICKYCLLRPTCTMMGKASPKPQYAFLKVKRASELQNPSF